MKKRTVDRVYIHRRIDQWVLLASELFWLMCIHVRMRWDIDKDESHSFSSRWLVPCQNVSIVYLYFSIFSFFFYSFCAMLTLVVSLIRELFKWHPQQSTHTHIHSGATDQLLSERLSLLNAAPLPFTVYAPMQLSSPLSSHSVCLF